MIHVKKKDLGVRTFINGLGVVLIALLIFLAEIRSVRWIFAAAVAAIAAIAIWEYASLVKKKGLSPPIILSIIAVIFYVFAVFFKTQSPQFFLHSFWTYAPEIILEISFFCCFVHFAIVGQPPITNIAATFLGIIYIGVPLGQFVQIMFFFTFDSIPSSYQGSWWIIYLIAVTKSADIGGYFVGRYFGKKKLALKLSPNKTLEGALGGFFVSTIISLFICFLGKKWGKTFEEFSYFKSLCLGIIIGILGQMGDLAESFLKRDAGAKDSNKIPGVGGVLDMIDSLLFTAPVIYLFLRITYS